MRRLLFSSFAGLALASAALAYSGATGVVKERMEGMKSMSSAAKALGAVKLGAIPYDPVIIRRAAGVIGDEGRAARHRFPEGSLTSPSEAAPLIWSDRAGFDAVLEEMIVLAADLGAAADDESRAMATADRLVAACKRCHERYREKKL